MTDIGCKTILFFWIQFITLVVDDVTFCMERITFPCSLTGLEDMNRWSLHGVVAPTARLKLRASEGEKKDQEAQCMLVENNSYLVTLHFDFLTYKWKAQ